MLEQSLLEGWHREWWDDHPVLGKEPKVTVDFCSRQVLWLAALRQYGWDVQVERKEANDGFGHAVDWRAENAGWRCKIDVQALNYQTGQGLLVDWKTGKSKGEDLQLMFNAICTAVRTGVMQYTGVFVYLDQQTTGSLQIDLTVEMLKPFAFLRQMMHPTSTIRGPMLDMFITSEQLREAYISGQFFAKHEDKWYCKKWCPVTYCEHCKVG